MARKDCKQAPLAVAVGAVSLAGNACAQLAVPPATAVAGAPGMCIVNGWEYAPRWSIMGADGEPEGMSIPTEAECAQMCAADPQCQGATWILYDTFTNQKNCWFKTWEGPTVAAPCEPDPSTTNGKTFNAMIKAPDCAAIQYKSEPMLCVDEIPLGPETTADVGGAPTAAPTEAAMPVSADAIPNEMELMGLMTPFKAFPDMDYSPDDFVTGSTAVEDLAKSVEMSATDCAQACIDLPGCNAATWMGANPTWTVTQNCFLKTFGTTCTLPPEAVEVPGAWLMIAQPPECPMMPEAAALAAPFPAPAAPAAAPVATADPFAPSAPAAAAPVGFADPAAAPDTAPPPVGTTGVPPLTPSTGQNAEAGTTAATDGAVSMQASTALLVAALSVAAAVFA